MPPKRRAAVNHKLVRGAKQARTTRRQTPGVHIVQEATADGESANYGNIEGGNRINVQSAQLVNAAQAANSATQVNEQLEKILQLLEHSGPGPVSANQQVRLGFSSPAISPNIGRIPDAYNEADGDAAWPANHIAGYGDSLSFRADGIDAHVKQTVREKNLAWRVCRPRHNPTKHRGKSRGRYDYHGVRLLSRHSEVRTTQGLLSYMETIRTAALRFGGDAWSTYDQQFRHRMSRDPSRRWDNIDGELWLKYMVTQPVLQQESGGRGAMTRVQGDIASQVCWDFKKFGCSRVNCKYTHKCGKCGKHSHSSRTCFRGNGVQPAFCLTENQPSRQVNSMAPSPVDLNEMAPWLRQYARVNYRDANYLWVGFSSGFKLEFQGSRTGRLARNLRSATHQDTAGYVKQKLQKEVDLGRMAGPFKDTPPRQPPSIPNRPGAQEAARIWSAPG
ncbi:uncharacterized protein LOC125372395 [Haliotis rufescens]|uniref:uncharacterized protein LOC125372395 n=1 Tax=Haliotis rufescens TaxID=6454 RepID=UPI00201EE3B5|nr:uncharacterized protein LOC125372395 [Haliotis rufescens]